MLLSFLRVRTSPIHSDEHRVGWLELFYDLVYVATIIALGNRLSDDISRDGVLTFAILFVPIWWSWTGMAFYITRFNIDDVGHRLLVFTQMFAIAALAIYANDGLGDTSQGFAVAYAAGRIILVLLYLRVGRDNDDARALARRYAQGFFVAALVWLVSAVVDEPARFVLWAIGMVVDFGTPLLPSTRRLQAAAPPSTHHLPERFGLFTIIVLGEAFIKVISGASGHELHLSNGVYGALALVIAASLWWLYFDNIQGTVVTRTRFAGQVWVYSHLPLVAAITAFGVAAKKIVLLEPDYHLPIEKRLLFSGALAIALIALAILDLTTSKDAKDLARNRLALFRIAGAIVTLVVGLLGESVDLIVMMALISVTFAVQAMPDIVRYLHIENASNAQGEPSD